ncbi:MAG: FKBP12-associated protein [Caeruleum heppii]|nr:MAG: FKBP12-associated protein [Caeruleum heppii]
MLITCECQHLKQEVRCNASKSSEGNITKSLSCDDECARLERNRKLALALEIDPETHKDDHIPYSKETLTRYSEDIKWAQSQERIFRVFAADDTERRLRLKPMPAGQRSFVHALAEDFGLDSESMDPEPRRHVAIFKTPRFVTAPMKTLAQAAQIRMLADPTGALEAQKRQASAASSVANAAEAPFNGFILDSPRFGLTIEEVHSTVDSDLSTLTEVSFDIQFLPSEEILIRSNVASTANEKTIEGRLKSLKPSILRHVTGGATSLAQSVQMCRSDASYNILRREGQFGNGTGAGPGGGWSQVAAKAAAPRMAPTIKGVGGGSLFTVLGRRTGTIEEGKKAKVKAKKKATEEVVEDWEKAVEEEEKIEWEKSQEDEGLEVGKVPSASVTADLPKAGDTNFDDDQGEKAGSKEMADRTILAEQPLEKNEGAQYGQEQVQRARLEVDGALGQADVQGRTD